MKATVFDARAGARERSRENSGAGEGQGIGSMRLFRIHVDPFEPCKWLRVEPGTIGKQSGKSGSRTRRLLSANVSNRRFEMQAANHFHTYHFVIIWSEHGLELPNPVGVRAARKPGKYSPSNAQEISALCRARQLNTGELAEFR